jgi:hypothetical protein
MNGTATKQRVAKSVAARTQVITVGDMFEALGVSVITNFNANTCTTLIIAEPNGASLHGTCLWDATTQMWEHLTWSYAANYSSAFSEVSLKEGLVSILAAIN